MSISSALSALADDVTAARAKITSKGSGVSSTNAFNGIPSDCIIYVLHGCLEAYQNATNWATHASYMMAEPT